MASIVDTSVKHAYSSMAGAPTINGTAGSLIAALDAFLVTGWGAKVVDAAAISGGVCRLNFASGKSAAEAHAVILVTGATPAGLNGEQKVTAVANGWVEFKTALADGAVTGSISFKMAPLGWEKVFSGTNKAVYRAVDPRGTRPFVRVDDSSALYARVQMYESMTDVDTGRAVTPPVSAVSGGYFWHKRQAAGATAGFWLFVGDSRGVYYCPAPAAEAIANGIGSYAVVPQYAGDLISDRSGDAWCGTLTGALTSAHGDVSGDVFQTGADAGRALMRASQGIGGSISCERNALAGGVSGFNGGFGPFPSKADNGLRLSAIMFADGVFGTDGPRGVLPGAYHCIQTGVSAKLGGNVAFTDGAGVFAGRVLLSVGVGYPASATSQGVAFFDASGPWRSA